MDQGSNKNHSPAYNFTPTVTKFCVMWEGLSLPHDTKFGNCRCKIVDSRSFHSWSLIHGLRWSGLIKVGPGDKSSPEPVMTQFINAYMRHQDLHEIKTWTLTTYEIFKCVETFIGDTQIHSLNSHWCSFLVQIDESSRVWVMAWRRKHDKPPPKPVIKTTNGVICH